MCFNILWYQWRVLISPVFVSLSCLIKWWLPSHIIISAYSPEDKKNSKTLIFTISPQQYKCPDKSRAGYHQTSLSLHLLCLLPASWQVILCPSVFSIAILWLLPTACDLTGRQAGLLARVNAAQESRQLVCDCLLNLIQQAASNVGTLRC